MKFIGQVFLCVVFSLSMVSSFKTGPPVEDNPEICESMFPSGHNVPKMNSTAPYKISVSSTCVKDEKITVTISTTSQTYFEGFFVQARPLTGENTTHGRISTHGTFDPYGDPQLQGLKCRNSQKQDIHNSLGHKQAKKYTNKTFTWTPPTYNIDGEKIQFVATIVRETPEIWMNVRSPVISTQCVSAATFNSSATWVSTMIVFVALTLLSYA